MTDLRKATKMAIDAMISDDVHKRAVAIVELRQALAQSKQEPVAAVVSWDKSMITRLAEYVAPATLLYTAPPSIEAAVLAEREACAKVCDLVAKEIDDTNGTATYCAKAIRARSDK